MAGGAINYFEGRKRRKAAEAALSAFEYQDLNNVHEGRQVSTMGADLQREENARFTSTAVDSLRNAGTRGLIGGLGRIQQQNNLLNRQIGANLDEQRFSIDRDIAQDDVRIRQMQEARDQQELAGIGAELEAGRQTQANGITSMIQSAQGGLLSLDSSTKQLAGAATGAPIGGGSQQPLFSGGSVPASTGFQPSVGGQGFYNPLQTQYGNTQQGLSIGSGYKSIL